jgi:hypothetical protein
MFTWLGSLAAAKSPRRTPYRRPARRWFLQLEDLGSRLTPSNTGTVFARV